MNKELHGFKDYSMNYLKESNDLSDKWILSRYNKTISMCNNAIDSLKLTDALKELYNFIWKDFCDWYIEIIKVRLLNETDENKRKALVSSVITLFDNLLRLLHPFMPFITEEIWQVLVDRKDKESIMIERMPEG